MDCQLAESYKLVIDSKDKEIERKDEKIEELESEIEEYEYKDKFFKGLLVVQAALLVIAFQIWDI